MNLCNFAKVIIARCTKDVKTIQWWNENENENTVPVPSHNQSISIKARYTNYQTYMQNHPQMHIEFESFKYKVPRIQKYLTDGKYWKNNNKNGEKSQFLSFFNLQSWQKLQVKEKQSHQLLDCKSCDKYVTKSILHTSASEATTLVNNLSVELIDNIRNIKNPRPSETVLNVLEPIVSNKLETSLKSAACKKYKLVPKQSSQEKQRDKVNIIRENNRKIHEILENDENGVTNFLVTNKSFQQYNKERLNTFFEPKSKAKKNLEKRFQDELHGIKKPKKHIGKLSNYQFDREKFIKEMKMKKKGTSICWSELGRQYNLRNVRGHSPSNAGQILLQFAKENGIDVFQFNTSKRVSGRDYFRRVKRAKHKLVKRLSIPVTRPVKKLKTKINKQIKDGLLYLGEKIAPKVVRTNIINKDGKMVEKEYKIYGRKIPLKNILQRFNIEQENLGIIRPSSSLKTRYLKFWHDHSEILNRSYFSIMVSCLYDSQLYLTDEEYSHKFPEKPPIKVQSLVERPKLYIFGQSKSTDREQLSYTNTRIEDLMDLNEPSSTPTGVKIFDIARIFTGDNPARQFEAGQQRGGKYSCICGIHVNNHTNLISALNQQTMSIFEKLEHFKAGVMWKSFSPSNINPLNNLSKESLINELDYRDIEYDNSKKSNLQSCLTEIMHGINRPAALLCPTLDNENLLSSLNLHHYEISNCEPLHDITNVVQNLLTELPFHMPSPELQKSYQSFSDLLVGEKKQIKGSDARLYAIKLALFTQMQYEDELVNADLLYICNALVDIIHICYSPANERSSKNILRLYNQCFLFSVLVRHVIENPKKMTSRKFYGAHFHSLVTHVPEMYRLFCLRSLVPEDEERTFGDLRSISLKTSNRHVTHVVDNCMLRFIPRENDEDKFDSLVKQETLISKQSKLLPEMLSTTIPCDVVKRSGLMQAHCTRIADFLVHGENVWWCRDEGHVLFFDGPNDEVEAEYHPPVHSYRSHSLKEEYKYLEGIWERCLKKVENEEINLPLQKIKIYQNQQYQRTIQTSFSLEDTSNELDTDISPLNDEEDVSNTTIEWVDNLQENEMPSQINSNMDTYDTLPSTHVDVNKDVTIEWLEDTQQNNIPSQIISNMDTNDTLNSTDDKDVTKDVTMEWDTQENNMTSQTNNNNEVKTSNTEETNKEIKQKYHALIKGRNDASVENSTSSIQKPMEKQKETEARKTFKDRFQRSENDANTKYYVEEECPFVEDGQKETGQNLYASKNDEQENEKISTSNLVVLLLGKTTEVETFLKYRKLAFENPALLEKYEKAKAIVETRILKVHSNSMRKRVIDPSSLYDDLICKAENLMDRWGTYYKMNV